MINFLYIAEAVAEMSSDEDKVGAIIVDYDGNILSYSYNRPPRGSDDPMRDNQGRTKSTTIHAEEGAILKAARSGISLEHATLYCTHSPCIKCAKMILEVGISKIVFRHQYKKGKQALNWLYEHGLTLSHEWYKNNGQ